ncbi:MAG: rod shape-determining protein MreC, partial [Gaiellaceae bacterium]
YPVAVAPPSRSARAAVLASSVQRSKPTPYPSKARSALIRRAIVVGLVVVALALITISFRSPTAGALHDVQGAGSTALRPFQVAATRVAQPFRDAYDYVDGLANARAKNKELRKEIVALQAKDLHRTALAAEEPAMAQLLHFVQGRTFPSGYDAVNTSVLSPAGGPFAHTLVVDAGSAEGVRIDSPVVNGVGLVGIVSNVFPHTATVTLLSDPDEAVAALDPHTGVRGLVHTGTGGTLILDQVNKRFTVKAGDKLVTAGTHSARYPDLYPYGIPIGTVTSVNAADTATFLQVQVQPYANLGAVSAVGVLVPKKQHR